MEFVHWALKENDLNQKSSISLHIIIKKIETFCKHSDPNKQLGIFYLKFFFASGSGTYLREELMNFDISKYVCRVRIEYIFGRRRNTLYHFSSRKNLHVLLQLP